MRPIRDIANASVGLLDELRTAWSGLPAASPREDASLDALLRYAMQSEDEKHADAEGVWLRLTGRVVGPFGRLAVEGPAGCSYASVIGATGVAHFSGGDNAGGSQPSRPVNIHGGAMSGKTELTR